MGIKDIYHWFDKRLNDPVWLTRTFRDQHKSMKEIASMIGCSEKLVNKKLESNGITMPDQILDVHTGSFHFAKRFVVIIAKPYIKKIQRSVDTIYNRTKARNTNIFKTIIADMERLDDDTGTSSFISLGYTRKALYLLAARFLVCLYEYDTYYSERMDYVLKRVVEKKDELYFDAQANPESWYPHRDYRIQVTNMFTRNTRVGEKSHYLLASKCIITEKEKEKEEHPLS